MERKRTNQHRGLRCLAVDSQEHKLSWAKSHSERQDGLRLQEPRTQLTAWDFSNLNTSFNDFRGISRWLQLCGKILKAATTTTCERDIINHVLSTGRLQRNKK